MEAILALPWLLRTKDAYSSPWTRGRSSRYLVSPDAWRTNSSSLYQSLRLKLTMTFKCQRPGQRSYCYISIVPCVKSNRLIWVRLQQPQEQRCPFLQCVQHLRMSKQWFGCQCLGFFTCAQMFMRTGAVRTPYASLQVKMARLSSVKTEKVAFTRALFRHINSKRRQ